MVFELIAVIVAGFAGAGVILLLNKLVKGRLPRWLMPAAAGAAMLAVTISNEYGWYPRTLAALPEGLEVAVTSEDRAFYRPWTFVVPFVSRFLAVDMIGVRSNAAAPGQRLVEVYAFGRWAAPQKKAVAVDCHGGRRADLTGEVSFGEAGALEGAAWRKVGTDDPIVRTVCRA
jgi:hypothetical protein